MNHDLNIAKRIATDVKRAGGVAYFVGGYVRDQLLGRENKDIDIEVHGVSPSVLESILDEIGEKTIVGASFGVYGLKHTHLDIALPRKESATGNGHKSFSINVDPNLGTLQCAKRRDFTINSIMQDILSGDIIDHFDGTVDLERRIIRHVNSDCFPEDPLRVLRAAQFAARFKFSIADDTINLCRQIDLSFLAKERVFEELKKALMKADSPSIFFEVLRKMRQLEYWFPEVLELVEVQQDLRFHPEGDVWAHTMQTIDAAAKLRENATQPFAFMLSALCHDFGKTVTTQEIDGVIRSLGHEIAGSSIASTFIQRLTNEKQLNRYVCNMTELHMRPNNMVGQGAGHKAFSRMFDQSICPRDLLLLAEADRKGQSLEINYEGTKQTLLDMLEEYERRMQLPFVSGADLISVGISPGPSFREALSFAHKLRLAAVPKEIALKQTIGFLRNKQDSMQEKKK